MIRGKTRLAKWYAPYTVSGIIEYLVGEMCWWDMLTEWLQDDEKIKLKGEVMIYPDLIGSSTLFFTQLQGPDVFRILAECPI